ncbi:MATE family efflux transporter [Campylobacter sputorum]|uniref:MATE family efflux transporter n=1 Tax=Campylobacter sputorum TaxID=206 RepID=UPI00226475C1|nr:MATE family efflux transporter [Campylobacter sputorum]
MKTFSLSKLAFPIYFDMILKLATIIINTYMISLIDVNLVGAMGAGNQIFSLFVTVFSFLAVGCSVFVAQALGANLKLIALKATHISISFNALLGLICGILVFIFSKEILHLLNIPDILLVDATHYLKALSAVFFIDAIAILISAIIRVYGYTMHILVVSIIINLITIIGNAIVLFEPFGMPHLGLLGVGISTAFGRFIGIFMLCFVLFGIIGLKFYFAMLFKFKLSILQKILSVGMPSAGENLLWIGQYLVAFSFVASMGENSLSVQTIYFQISAFIFFGGSAISIANEVIVGRLVGSNELNLAYKKAFLALKVGIFSTAIFLCIVLFVKEFIMNLYHLNDELKNIMRPLFYLSLVLELGRTLNIVMVNSLRASGDAKFPFLMGIIFMWGVSLPVGYFLGIYMQMGILGVWIGFACDEWLRGLANTYRWKSKKWQNKRLV